MTNDNLMSSATVVVDNKSKPNHVTIDNERDRKIIEGGDANFKPFTWSDLKDIISKNELGRLSRKPSDLSYYHECKQRYKVEYGGVLPFIIKERLQWTPDVEGNITPKNTTLLGDVDDVKVLYNDFPYGVESQIYHVVVWSKAKIPNCPPVGDLTDEARDKIESYVLRTFCDHLGMDRKDVLWFKNWSALQSVRALEHFHVMLNDPPKEKLDALIGGPGFL